MRRRWFVSITVAIVLLAIAVVVAIESGALVRFMATPSDWEPQPMPTLEVECGRETTPIPWGYCLHRRPGSTSRDLLVHLHGRRGTERWWNDSTYYPAELYARWEETGAPAPAVVSISFGPLWLLVGETGDAASDVFDRARERSVWWLGHDVERVMVVGESMGGYNALLAGLDGGDRFARVASLCPPLSTRSPFGTDAFDRLGESSAREAFMLLTFSRAFFEDEAQWRSTDPVPRILGGEPFEPSLYLSCGLRDPWGCASATRALGDALTALGAEPQVHLLEEGHCAIDPESLADFLVAPE